MAYTYQGDTYCDACGWAITRDLYRTARKEGQNPAELNPKDLPRFVINSPAVPGNCADCDIPLAIKAARKADR